MNPEVKCKIIYLSLIASMTFTLRTFSFAETTSSTFNSFHQQRQNTCRIEVNVRTSLNVRLSPWGRRCGNVRNGHVFDVVGRSGDWLQVRACNQIAYVNQVGFSGHDWRNIISQSCSPSRDEIVNMAISTPQETDISGQDIDSGRLWRGDQELQRIAMSAVQEQRLHELNPSDIGAYCPNYSRLNENQRQTFWSAFLFAVSIPESNMRSEVTHRESFSASCRLSSGNQISGRVVSSGLLQVSACSCIGYGENIQSLQTLQNPESNISCGARILHRQIGRHGVIRGRVNGRWRGASSYWAVIRNTTKNNEVQEHIQQNFANCFN